MKGQRAPAEMLVRLRKQAKRRLKAIQAGAENDIRWYREKVPDGREKPTLRDVELAVARSLDFPGWGALKNALETPLPDPRSAEGIVSRFLDNACPDHHVRGRQDHLRAEGTAMRLLAQHPEVARHDFNTAVVCGDVEYVRAAMARDPRIAVVASSGPSAWRGMGGGANDLYNDLGPKGWTPLLYLCFTRLPLAAANDNALEVARLLLEAGADPNAFFHAGDSHYTPLTGIAGEGEEDRPPHPRRDELARLLLAHGAHPYDIQVVYDLGFKSDYMWFLPLIHDHSLKTGRGADWKDPDWTMLSMGGYGCGARWFLHHAIVGDKAELARWCLEHGAGPNPPPPRDERMSQHSSYEQAVRAGRREIADLLLRHGAKAVAVKPEPIEMLTDAALRLDRTAVDTLLRVHPELRRFPLPLHRAASANNAAAIHLLIDAGFSPDVADAQNLRALHEAAYANALEAAKALVDRGAEIDSVEQNHGGTPFGGASHFLNRAVMNFLVPLTKDVWNLTYNGYAARLKEVLDEKPERARVDWDTWSPLLWLPPHDEKVALEIVKLFVRHGADPHRRDSNGVSPIDRAEALGMARLVAHLRSLSG